MPTIRSAVRRSARLTALGRGFRDAIWGLPNEAGRRAVGEPVPGIDGVAELHRVTPKPAPAGSGPRLNLLIPTLSPGRVFGGAQTALDLFDALSQHYARLRIVAFQPIPESALDSLEGFMQASPGDERVPDRVVVAAPRGSQHELAVGPDDVFLATFWTTAELAGRLVAWQSTTYERPAPRPFAYLVQDFEPGFYPWSAQSELARSTYAGAVPTIGVVNSGLLAAHLAEEGVTFAEQFTFEPRMDRRLRRVLGVAPHERARRLVAYGRPETPRNAFPLVVEGLGAWVRVHGGSGWEVVSVGRHHPPVELGRGLRMRALGKLDIEAYASLLTESAVGLSLMVSPHPSYPPLDMAHLGMRVVTNTFGPKDLSAWHENIRSVDALTASSIAEALAAQVAVFEADPHGGEKAHALRPDYLADGPIFPFAETLAERLNAGL
ncbi:MAG TPA: hypothetical protein VFV72_00795 [Candidatus Limnocylindrales bacterium]|nr:hypothetical protein [Candidatus Limnocylindrales bacterium]